MVRPEYLIILKLLAGSDQDFIDRKPVKSMAKQLFMDGELKKLVEIAKRLP
ncbi:MAG: hypothetical protein HY026_07050 [Deltaproteobacteria bacterium]|nr:hypothetical protein [Deltaproteobacteria bacterium]